VGFAAFAFSLVGHMPFLLSFVRMWWRDSEATRLIFYRACKRTWIFAFLISVWSAFNLYPLARSQCQAINAFEYSDDTGWNQISNAERLAHCELQVRITRICFYLLFSDLQFGLLVLLARRNWQLKRRQREERERTYLHGIKKCQVFAKEMPLQSFIDDEKNYNPFNVHQAFTLLQKGPKTVKLLV
jgi:hypothetical protein